MVPASPPATVISSALPLPSTLRTLSTCSASMIKSVVALTLLCSFSQSSPQYSFSLQDDSGLSVDLDSGATSASTDFSGPWPTHDYPHDSLLFGDTSGLLTSMSFPHASSDVPVHDGYYPYNPQIGVSHPTRTLPRIQVATEFPRVAASASGSQRESHSPWAMTPSPLLPPFAPSPSSIGSAPPYTPDTPYHTYTISPRGSPYIDQPAASPVSPSAIMGNGSVYGGDSQMSLPAMAFQPREAASAIDLAAAAGHPLGQRFVPQKTYKPHTLSDRRRYVDEVSLEAPIMFYALNPAGCGISLEDAIKSRFSKLDGRDDPMFEGRGPSVSIRLNVSARVLLWSSRRLLTGQWACYSVAGLCAVESPDPDEGFPEPAPASHACQTGQERSKNDRPLHLGQLSFHSCDACIAEPRARRRWRARSRRTPQRPSGASAAGTASDSRTSCSSACSTSPWARGRPTSG